MVVVESFGRGLFSAVDSLLLEIMIFRRAKSFLKGEDVYSRDFLSRVSLAPRNSYKRCRSSNGGPCPDFHKRKKAGANEKTKDLTLNRDRRSRILVIEELQWVFVLWVPISESGVTDTNIHFLGSGKLTHIGV